ncbi:hypothetical protein WA026_014460 [Henosepilachna vigintioctopunctata]|uniref:Uncharacterized protein n=1 Tax=Henosepilachna vigintioctopunctata TaxID=420089 RepID=A0AAW1UBN5_9CUCU
MHKPQCREYGISRRNTSRAATKELTPLFFVSLRDTNICTIDRLNNSQPKLTTRRHVKTSVQHSTTCILEAKCAKISHGA